MKMTILGSVLAGSTLLASIAQAEDTISAVHAFPETLIYTKSFLSFVDKVNAAGEGVVQIDVRGIGVVIFLLFTVFIGWVAKGYIGRSLIRYAESLVERTPVVRSIYSGIKQISETVFAQSERSFEKACLIEYPRKGIWAIGFISTTAKGEVSARAGNTGALLSIFVPTTPNPTSGFLLFFPAEDVIELDMSVEDAAKLVISAGLVYPNDKELIEAITHIK